MKNVDSVDLVRTGVSAWDTAVAYSAGTVVSYEGLEYFCHAAHTSTAIILPTNVTYWAELPYHYIAAGATRVGGQVFRAADVCTFQALGSCVSGTGTATILVQASNEPVPSTASWFTLDTLSLTLGTVVTQDNGYHIYPFRWVRGNVSVITGTGANVSCYLALIP